MKAYNWPSVMPRTHPHPLYLHMPAPSPTICTPCPQPPTPPHPLRSITLLPSFLLSQIKATFTRPDVDCAAWRVDAATQLNLPLDQVRFTGFQGPGGVRARAIDAD